MDPSAIPREAITWGGIAPAIVVGVGMLFAWAIAPKRRAGEDQARDPGQERGGPHWVAPLLVALAYLPADFAINTWPQLWPRDATMRFPHVAALAAIGGLASALWRGPAWIRDLWHALVIAGAALIVLLPFQAELGARGLAIWCAGVGLAGAAVTGVAARAAVTARPWRTHLALIPYAFALPPVLLYGSTATLAQQSGSLIAMLAAATIASLVLRRASLGAGGLLVVVTLGTTLLLAARMYVFDPLPWPPYALAGVAPTGCALLLVPALRRRPIAGTLAAIGAVAILAAASATIAYLNRPPYDMPY